MRSEPTHISLFWLEGNVHDCESSEVSCLVWGFKLESRQSRD